MKNDKEKYPQHSRITDWPENERPREKLLDKGSDSLSSAELIAILLGTGTGKTTAVDLGKSLIKKFGSIEKMSQASLNELTEIQGIGPAKAITLMAAFQLSRNMHREVAEKEFVYFKQPSDVAKIFIPMFGHEKKEMFAIALMDTAGKYMWTEKITIGTLNASLVHAREIFKPAIKHSAASIILVHNHPSGQLTPSAEDLKITKQIVEAGRLLDISVHDHLIVTQESYISLKEEGYI
jgi:DNA repair protein RadC